MKKLVLFAVLLTISMNLLAQNDVTQFLGIPVDGYKPEMIQKLKDKGFVCVDEDEGILKGEFNGTRVLVYVVTTNNKVSRIMLADEYSVSDVDIKIRFNKLCSQFQNNPKYISFEDDQTIPDGENIKHEMLVYKKRYEAVYYQQTEIADSSAVTNAVMDILLSKYSEEELENPTEEIQKDMFVTAGMYAMDLMSKKPVWFMISDRYGEYYITMFYDNEYNRANGDDL
ncbi:MAG: hypothetical protein LUC24_04790 [Bacteroidales bacterium]|nr:hypothetical protein [Bacteroidales bacterium]